MGQPHAGALVRVGNADRLVDVDGMMESSWIQDQLATLFGESVKLLDLFLFADFGTGIPLVVAILFSLNGKLRDIFTAY